MHGLKHILVWLCWKVKVLKETKEKHLNGFKWLRNKVKMTHNVILPIAIAMDME